ncbi:hypothetical protein OF83DRAFT_1088923 [Amylostereum chailletii]|nr:hypothetical protein OF83DRAFT_1088923 [Amylostereum chailletii]
MGLLFHVSPSSHPPFNCDNDDMWLMHLGFGVKDEDEASEDGFQYQLELEFYSWETKPPSRFQDMFRFIIAEYCLSQIEVLTIHCSETYSASYWNRAFKNLNSVHTLFLDKMPVQSIFKALGQSPTLLPSLRKLTLHSLNFDDIIYKMPKVDSVTEDSDAEELGSVADSEGSDMDVDDLQDGEQDFLDMLTRCAEQVSPI